MESTEIYRIPTGTRELDRILGGGFPHAFILLTSHAADLFVSDERVHEEMFDISLRLTSHKLFLVFELTSDDA